MSRAAYKPERTEERERRRRTRDFRRDYFTQLTIDFAYPVEAAIHWLFPWDAHHYPGLGRGLRQLCQNRVAAETACKWRRKNCVPLWALERIAQEIRRRAAEGQRIANVLDEELARRVAEPQKPRGLQIIDGETGLPKYRNRVGRSGSMTKGSAERIAASSRPVREREI
jgi:hypothetical protein